MGQRRRCIGVSRYLEIGSRTLGSHLHLGITSASGAAHCRAHPATRGELLCSCQPAFFLHSIAVVLVRSPPVPGPDVQFWGTVVSNNVREVYTVSQHHEYSTNDRWHTWKYTNATIMMRRHVTTLTFAGFLNLLLVSFLSKAVKHMSESDFKLWLWFNIVALAVI